MESLSSLILDSDFWRWIAAAAGGCTYPFLRPEPTWRRNITVAIIGTAVSVIVSPVICEAIRWQTNHACATIHAALGLGGMMIAKVGVTFGESTLTPKWMTKLLYRFLGVPEVDPTEISVGVVSGKCQDCRLYDAVGLCSCGWNLCRSCFLSSRHRHSDEKKKTGA